MKTPESHIIGFFVGWLFLISISAFAEVDTPQKNTLPLKDVQRFTNAISQIKNYYVEPVSDNELFNNAIRGMLNGLDPHSSYLDEEEFRQLTSVTQGEFGGLGLEVTMEDGIIKVISPLDDSPAAKAGIKSGDLIIRLDESPIKGMSLNQAIDRMRGKKGTPVNLTIIRQGKEEPIIIKIVRDVIKVKSVTFKMLEPGYGYIRLSAFQTHTGGDLANAIKQLTTDAGGKLKGLVLDLRNNPGGLLDSAIEVSDAFLDSNKLGPNKLIVYTEGRVPGAHFEAKALPDGDLLKGSPLVVLINQGSASASEIVAGALQDHKRAILVGTTTFGKGSVQTVLPLDNMTGIKLTTALYYTPNGRSIQAQGIKPDITINQFKLNKPNSTSLDRIKEADLRGHLLNVNENKDSNKDDNKKETTAAGLPFEDYTLYEGLNILKSLVFTQARN